MVYQVCWKHSSLPGTLELVERIRSALKSRGPDAVKLLTFRFGRVWKVTVLEGGPLRSPEMWAFIKAIFENKIETREPGPLPVTSRVIIPLTRVITSVTHL